MMNLKIGVGKYDVTGPSAEIGFMGMSNLTQRGRGIHTRLYSRAYVFEDLNSGKHVALVVADLGMCFQAVYLEVIKKLHNHPDLKVNGKPIYTEENVLVTATHTHSGPGGYSHYFIYNLSMIDLHFASGFNGQNFDCIVEGILQSIVLAHKNKVRGKILIAKGNLPDCGKIRSLPPYLNNPEINANTTSQEGGVEPLNREMTLLKFVDERNVPMGSINWYALHPTNMGEKNKLISSDNKGYAEELMETEFSGVISAFANECCGDISPNVGLDEDDQPLKRPEGLLDIKHTRRFGKKQYENAKELYNNAQEELDGPIDYRHTYVDMSSCPINGTTHRTWPAAYGLGMSQGSTEDSKSPLKWPEGLAKPGYDKDPESELGLIRLLASALGITWPSPDEYPQGYIEGHGAKPIFMHLGLSKYKEGPLVPAIMPLQLIRLGNLVLIAHPGELTTIAGKRLRDAVLDTLNENNAGIKYVVAATYANAYTSYTTTKEEYELQHYEGASTLFGPHTLEAYIQENKKLAAALRDNQPVPRGPEPPDLSEKYSRRITGVPPEKELIDHHFGDVEGDQPRGPYHGGDTVKVSFWGGHPNNDLKTNSTYLEIQKKVSGQWEQVYTDRHFCTTFHWQRRVTNFIIDILWEIPQDQSAGTYRIRYYGHWKKAPGQLIDITGTSKEFEVA